MLGSCNLAKKLTIFTLNLEFIYINYEIKGHFRTFCILIDFFYCTSQRGAIDKGVFFSILIIPGNSYFLTASTCSLISFNAYFVFQMWNESNR